MSSAWLKTGIVFAAVLIYRLIPFRAPNVEPLLASVMPLGKRYGALTSVAFTIASFVVYDALTAGIGMWTIVPGACYALVALASAQYFKTREATRGNFVKFGIVSIIFYDAVTGVIAGPLMSSQTFANALYGQIPFTILHLAGAVSFAAILSPVIYRWLAEAPAPAFAPAEAR